VQEAASATLVTKTGPAKSAGRQGVQAQAKTSFQAILGAKAQAGKKVHLKESETKAALLKAISGSKGVAAKAQVPRLEEAHQKKHGADGLGHLLAQAVEKDKPAQKQQNADTAVSPAADHGADHQKKKTAKTPGHPDLPGVAVPVVMSLLGIKNAASPGQKPAEQGKPAPENPAAIHPAAGRKTNELRVHVVDARKKHAEAQAQDANAAVKVSTDVKADKDAAPIVITREPAVPETSARETRGQSPVPQTPAGAALDRLREMAGSELTRAAGIILRDGGGELKLTLKPESLGSVRIRMNLVDNSIEGRIIVDNTAVKHIFEGSLDSLMRALTAEGFQTASLQVSVGGQGSDNGRQDKDPATRPRRVEGLNRTAGSGMDWNVPGAENLSLGDLLVNLFV